ncbi:hypothetical protein Hanom_Chr10g00925971 [Helianthus anomalus]
MDEDNVEEPKNQNSGEDAATTDMDPIGNVHKESNANKVTNDEGIHDINGASQHINVGDYSIGKENMINNKNNKGNFYYYSFGNTKVGEKIGLKKFKRLDRKGRAQSKSPQDKVKPNKRARSGDPFGLNPLLGIVDSNTSPS